MADKITIKHRYTNAVLFEYTPTDEQQASGQRKPAAPFAPPDAFTDAQLLEADRHLAGPARDPQFFNRRTELYEQRSQQEAERLELLHIREAV